MRDALSNLGADLGGGFEAATGHKTTQNDIGRQIAELRKTLIKYGNLRGKVGGGGRSRTADAADMSRVL